MPLKTYDIREVPEVRLSGRFDPEQAGFPMMWSGACAEMTVRASRLDVRIRSEYRTLRPYLSFEVDGLRAQTFAPLRGTHWVTVMLGMDAGKPHRVRITLETQTWSDDPASYAALLELCTDGVWEPLPAPALKLEIIGDSITSGEGLRGPRSFMEWVPMCFGASDAYPRLLAEELRAQVQVISQSGWGVLHSWDNNPRQTLPGVYDRVCGPAAMHSAQGMAHGGEKAYDFAYDPDAVIVNLGTNDGGALAQPAFVDPESGESHRFTREDLPEFERACVDFLAHVHEKNPRARLIWAFGVAGDTMGEPVRNAVRVAKERGLPVTFVALPDAGTIRGGIGSRDHPGTTAHRKMAEILKKELQDSQ